MLNKLLQWLFGVSLVRTPRSLMSQKGIRVEDGNFVTSKGAIPEEPPKRECPLEVKPSAITKDDDLGIVMPDFSFDDPTETKPMVVPASVIVGWSPPPSIKEVVYAVHAGDGDRNTASSTISFMVSLDTMGRVRGLSYPPLDCLKAHESWGDAGIRALRNLQPFFEKQFSRYYGNTGPKVRTTPMKVIGGHEELLVRYLPPVSITKIPNQPRTARAKGVTHFYAVQDLDKVILNKGEETRDAVLARGPRIKVALENGLAVKYKKQYWISIPGLVLMTGLEITRKTKVGGGEKKLPIRDGIKYILDQLR